MNVACVCVCIHYCMYACTYVYGTNFTINHLNRVYIRSACMYNIKLTERLMVHVAYI